jgi:phosphatidylinositol-3-phosphatase
MMRLNAIFFFLMLLAVAVACGCGGVTGTKASSLAAASNNVTPAGTSGTSGSAATPFATGTSSGTTPPSTGTGTPTTPTPTPAPTPAPTPVNPPTPTTPPTAINGIPHSGHVFLLIEENHGFTTVFANEMPYLTSLAKKYAYAASYSSNDGGSMLDYLDLSSGSNEAAFGCQGWGCPNQMSQPITDDNIFRELTKAGLTWKVYAESLPQAGYLLDGPAPYVSRHNPAVWYSDVVNSTEMQKNVVPFSQFATDMAAGTLPNYSIVIPNLDHDAHDGTPAAADTWLQSNIGPLLKTSLFASGGDALMFVTFDECGSGTNQGCGSQVLTTVIGPKVTPQFVSTKAYTHFSTLRTIMDALGVQVYPGGSATANDMSDFFGN